MAVLKEVTDEVTSETRPLSGMVGGVSRGAVGRRRKKKPASILDEVTEEVSKEPVPEGALEQVMRETETDPEKVRRMRTEGQPLTVEQQRVAFEAERARPLTDVALGAAGAFIQAAPEMAWTLAKGTAQLGYGGLIQPMSQSILAGLTLDPDAEKQAEKMRKIWGLEGAAGVYRSLASGAAQDLEETANAAIRAGMFGTSITDLAAEKLGLIDKEQSFDNYLSREEMRRGEAEDIQENPDRAATLLARNPLAGTVIEGAAVMSGMGALTPEQKKAALDQYQEKLYLDAKFVPNPNISAVGEVALPGVSLPAAAVRPLTKALGGTMEAAGGLAVRGVTKPTIRGVNPLEGVGIGIRKIGEGAEKAGAGVSQAITGRPDTFLAAPGTIVSAFTKRPGQLVEGVGRTLRDVGRQIDEGGIRGRTGIVERLGRDPASADWIRDLFGPGAQKRLEKMERANKKRVAEGKAPIKPGRGGVVRARTADYGLRLANSLAKSGTSGAVLNGIIGAADVETAEEFGRQTGVGFGIGTFMGARVPERIGAALDPRTDLRTRINRVTEIDPLDRRLDEDADRKRYGLTTDPKLIRQAERMADPDVQIGSRAKELDALFQRKAEADYAEQDTTDLDMEITQRADELAALQETAKNMTQEQRDELRRDVELIMIDVLDQARATGASAGINNIGIEIVDTDQVPAWLRGKWGATLERAEAIVNQLGGQQLSQSEEETLKQARDTIAQFNSDLSAAVSSHLALSPDSSPVTSPEIMINADYVMNNPMGLRHALSHELNHALSKFKEVQTMQQPARQFLFGKSIDQFMPDGTVRRVPVGSPGLITNEVLETFYIPRYAARMRKSPEAWKKGFPDTDTMYAYIREEIMSELAAVSEGGYQTMREGLDSPGQAVVDWLLTSNQNSMLGRLRQALEMAGVELNSQGDVQSLLFGSEISIPEVLAMMRQYKRQLLEYTDTMTFVGGKTQDDVEISLTELMTNRALQEVLKDDVIWDKEIVLDVRDPNGNALSQIVIPDSPVANSAAIGEYRIVNGQLVDENGNVLPPIDPTINLSAFPEGSSASVDNRIARNPDGSPKILQNKEIEARARQRDQMIKDAIDNAPEDGFEGRMRGDENGNYTGTLSPSQVEAIMALPNTLVTPYVKKNLIAFSEVLQRRDGTRILMEYQPALKRGRYRALAPKIRDVVPIGFRFTKQGNWLAVTASVSRMFDKMNLWAQKKPENLNLWGRSTSKFWADVMRVLDNHNRGLAGQTNLDVDPDIAMQKKNRINDFFNMFSKETEASNPSRTKLPARRGQDSADRIIMSARMDRINQMQISNATKMPIDYGKMKINFFPERPNGALRLDQSQDLEVENDIVGGMTAQFLPGIRYTSLPDDPKKTMADFYMLNAMLTTPPTGWSMGKFGGKATMYAPSQDPTGRYAGVRAEKYKDALDEAKQTLIPTLHSKIQKALHFAVAAELRHAIPRRQPADLAESEFYQEYMRQYAIQGAGMPDLKKEKGPRRYKGESEGYKASFVAMENARKKLGMSIADVARFAEQLYRRGDWSSSYGGNPWGDIAAHLAQMSDPSYSTERVRAVATDPETGRMQVIETNEFRDPGAYSMMFQEIDRAYDLQHNTNTVFNKLKKYYMGAEGYGWIAKMLDFKANVANPRELRGLVSGTMGKLADAWFADMRADAPQTQDLEAKVVEQLPESFTQNMDPAQFLEILKDTVGDHYRSSSDPFAKIASEAKEIFRKNKGGYGGDWDAIKKDQNAHIGLLLDDNFGDLGVARTDAIKLFRMLLVEGKDPRVTGKKPSPSDVPNVEIKLPKPKPMADQNWFMGSTFKPKIDVSTVTNLNKFVESLMAAGFNGLKLGDVTVVNAGGFGKTTTLKVYAGDSVSEGYLLATAQIPGGKKQDIYDWLANYAAERALKTGYGNTADWMQQNLKAEMKPQMPTMSKKIEKFLRGLPYTSKARVDQLIKDLQNLEWVDANQANLPPSDIDDSADFVADLLIGSAQGLAKAKIEDVVTPDDIMTLGKYLYDLSKWASDKLDARKSADMDQEVEEIGLVPESMAVGYSKPDGTIMTIAEAAETAGPYDAGSNLNHAYFTDNSGTAITNPYEDTTGDPIAAEWAPGNKTAIMQYWADNGVLPSVSEAALAIFDLANPGHPYLKPAEGKGAAGKIAAETDAIEFLDNMLIDDEPTVINGNTWELEGIENEDNEIIGAVVKLNGIAVSNQIPVDPETMTLAVEPSAAQTDMTTGEIVYQDYFALDWTKDWKAPKPFKKFADPNAKPAESESLLTPEQDEMMQAAAALMDPEINEYIHDGKVFSKKVTNSGAVAIQANYLQSFGGSLIGIIPILGSQNMDPIDLEAAIYEAIGTLKTGPAPTAPGTKTKPITTAMINEAADALMNDETTSLGKYTFEPIASGLGGTRVNIYVEPGMEDSVGYFTLDPGRYREPSDMLDAFYDKISEFLENNPEFDGGTSGTGPGAKFMPAADVDYLTAVERGDMETAQRMVDERLAEAGAFWHGTPSGDLRGGMTGLHVGTRRAAMEALEARIGIPADGRGWNGDREYGKTLLAGKDRINSGQFGKHRLTGFNVDAPNEDYYPSKMPTVGKDVLVDPKWKPWLRPVLIVGKMTDNVRYPISDAAANRRIKRKRGAYYTNTGEDSGSISAVLPDGESVRVKLPDPVTYDDQGNIIPLSQRFNPKSSDVRFMPAGFYDPDEDVPSLRQKAWITPDGEIVNVEPGSEHRLVARSFYPDAESDEKAQMAAEDEGYLRVIRQGSRVNVGGRTPNSSQKDTLTRLQLDHDYEIQDDRGRPMAARFMPASATPMRAAAIRIGDRIFEGPMHMIARDAAWEDSDIQKMFDSKEEFEDALHDSDLVDSMDYLAGMMGDKPSPPTKELPEGMAGAVTFGFVDRDGNFYNRREAMDAVYGGRRGEPGTTPEMFQGPLFSEDLPGPGARFMPGVPVPDQKTLNRMKRRLPKYEARIKSLTGPATPAQPEEVIIQIRKPQNRSVIGRASLLVEDPFDPDSIIVASTFVRPSDRGKGYGEALYREIAKYAQSQKKKYILSTDVSSLAAKARKRLFEEEETMAGPWEQSGDLMLSRVNPRIQYMPAGPLSSSQVDQSLAGVTAPDTDQGPLSGASLEARPLKVKTGFSGYHVTYRDNVPDILKDGLSVSMENNEGTGSYGSVFFSDLAQAQAFAQKIRESGDGAEPTILEVYIPKGKTVYADPATIAGTSYYISENIPAKNIRELDDEFSGIQRDISKFLSAQFMPADTSRLIDIEGVRPFKIPRPVKIGKNRWRVGDVVTSKEPDADAAAMIAGLQRLAMHSKGVDSRKALSSVFVTLKDNPYFKRLLAMSQENLQERGMNELYRGVGLDEKRSQLTRDAKSFTEFYDLADMVAEANAESRRGLEPEVLRISPVGKFPVIEDGAINDIAEELGINRSKQPHMPGKHMEGAFGEGEVFVAPSSAKPGARFMPGYNPRYTDDDGNFDRNAWLNDRRRAEAELRRRGYRRVDYSDTEWDELIRWMLRETR